MTKKYNLALTPNRSSKEVVECAQQFSNIADKYLLGEKSLPHVTLYQFEIDENQINNVWNLIQIALDKKSINLEFKKFSYLTFDNVIYWISLLPNSCEILHKMHTIIAETIKMPIKKYFDPHMTLLNTKNKDYEKEADKLFSSFTPISDEFVLTLGKSDDIGQFTEVVHRYELI